MKLSHKKIDIDKPKVVIDELDAIEIDEIKDRYSIIDFDSLYTTTKPPSDDYDEPDSKQKKSMLIIGVILMLFIFLLFFITQC
jgi:hypothetical protein